MRIFRLESHGFGRLVGETLELSDGLTVVHGPNESGKSTWHAALYAGLCGRPGGPHPDHPQQYRPWYGERWAVSAHVELDNGRRVVLHQVFDGSAGSRAVDPDGHDYSAEL